MTNIQAIDLLKGLEQSLDDYCELNDEGKTAFRMAITALEVFGISEQLPSAQPEPLTVTRDHLLTKDECDRLKQTMRETQILLFPPAQPTLYGYNIEHLDLIARVLQKENLPPDRVTEILTDIGRIVAIVIDEFEESLRKAVEQCMT